jgi:hypothetical protein
MLKLRRAELQEQIATDAAGLTQVEARLLAIESEASEPARGGQANRGSAGRRTHRHGSRL